MVFCVLKPPFVVAEPVCLAVPEEPVDEPWFAFVAVLLFRESAVFVADRLWDRDAEPVSNCQKVSRLEEGFRGVLGD